MERKGLCITCERFAGCIFAKHPPIWSCEEFYEGNHVPIRSSQAGVKKAVVFEEATEAE